jgi:hypothetical protein
MITLFKKQPTVEQIHAEFDSAEERILQECDNLLNELKIPTETQLERKATMIAELGFVNSETVKQAATLKEKSKTIQHKLEVTKTQAELIREFKVKYPNEKFITIDELERICEKYNLIHAPAVNYIKDIPEKNVLEMVNCKKLEIEDKFQNTIELSEFNDLGKVLLAALGKTNNPTFTLLEMIELNKYWIKDNIGKYAVNSININSDSWFTLGGEYYLKNKNIDTSLFSANYPRFKKAITISKEGLFIAAPKSHFDLNGLDKKSKYGFFKVTVTEVKDPVVFEYCKNNICRIITKWGTDDDQSYLDPALLNETLN